MALSYFSAAYTDISRGIDKYSVPNLIPDGYSQDLINCNTNANGHVQKRKGYQGYYGYVPVRIKSVTYSGTTDIEFTLDGTIDLKNIADSPLIVYGTLGDTSMDGDFTSAGNTSAYYNSFTAEARTTLATGDNTITKTSSQTGITSDAIAVGISESTSATVEDNEQFIADEIEVTASSYQIEVDYNNGTGAEFDAFLYYKDKTAVGGEVSHHTITAASSLTVTAAQHNLDNYNIIAQVEELDTGVYSQVIPDSVTINQTTGQVVITLSSTITGRAILTAVNATNLIAGTVAAGATNTVTISGPDTPYSFTGCYLDPGTGTLEQVLPDSVIYDELADETAITFVNGTGAEAVFEIYYEFATLNQNKLTVTGTVSVTGTDTEPQLTLWGLNHEDIYATSSSQEGHVTHIDSYKTISDSRLVCGLGGNLFKTTTPSEIGNTVAPTYYINLRGRVNADTLGCSSVSRSGFLSS